MPLFSLFLFKNFELRYNSQTVKFTHLKCIIQWFSVYSELCKHHPSPRPNSRTFPLCTYEALLIGHLCVFTGECLFKSFTHVLIRFLVIFLLPSCKSSLYILVIRLIRYKICRYFLSFFGLSFNFLDSVL